MVSTSIERCRDKKMILGLVFSRMRLLDSPRPARSSRRGDTFMHYRRLGLVAMMSIAVGVATAALAVQVSATSAAAPVTNAKRSAKARPDVTVRMEQRSNSHCEAPKRQKINIAYQPGWLCTTFYFNSHCKQRSAFKVMG